MRKLVGPIIVICIVIAISALFLSVVIPHEEAETTDTSSVNNNPDLPHDMTVTPSTEVGNGIHVIKENNNGVYIASLNSNDGQTYYFTSRETVYKLYKVNKGNWTEPFNCTVKNGTVNGVESAHIVTDIN